VDNFELRANEISLSSDLRNEREVIISSIHSNTSITGNRENLWSDRKSVKTCHLFIDVADHLFRCHLDILRNSILRNPRLQRMSTPSVEKHSSRAVQWRVLLHDSAACFNSSQHALTLISVAQLSFSGSNTLFRNISYNLRLMNAHAQWNWKVTLTKRLRTNSIDSIKQTSLIINVCLINTSQPDKKIGVTSELAPSVSVLSMEGVSVMANNLANLERPTIRIQNTLRNQRRINLGSTRLAKRFFDDWLNTIRHTTENGVGVIVISVNIELSDVRGNTHPLTEHWDLTFIKSFSLVCDQRDVVDSTDNIS